MQPETIYTNTATNGLIFSTLFQTYNHNLIKGEFEDFILINKLLNYAENMSHKRIIDLGCGFGSSFVLFVKRYLNHPEIIFHIDINPDVFLREASYRGGSLSLFPGVAEEIFYSWDQDVKMIANAEKIPLKNESIDLINVSMLFADNYALREESVFLEISRILKKNGLLFISDPDCVCYELPDFETVSYCDMPLVKVFRKTR